MPDNELLTYSKDDIRSTQEVRQMTRPEVMRAYDVRESDRKSFLVNRRKEKKGEGFHHRTTLGPTHRGKTTLELQILKSEITPDNQAIILSAQPPQRDPVMNKAAEQLNLVTVDTYPPTPMARRYHRSRKKNGYLVRPEQSLSDLDSDHRHVRQVFSETMLDAYSRTKHDQPVIVVCDEAHKICNIYNLNKEYEAILMSGMPDVAESSLIQRGRFMSYLAYDAPDEIIIFKDDDTSNQRRYAEIGGINPTAIVTIQSGLKTYETKDGHTISEFIHIKRAGPVITVVGIE